MGVSNLLTRIKSGGDTIPKTTMVNTMITMIGVKYLLNIFKALDRFKTNAKTNTKYIQLVRNGDVPNSGAIAISCVTAAVRGVGKTMIIRNIIRQYTKLNFGDTILPKSSIEPCNLACPKKDSIGITVVVIKNPMATNHQSEPELKPKNGGRIKFPAPKKPANNANPNRKILLVSLINLVRIVLSSERRN